MKKLILITAIFTGCATTKSTPQVFDADWKFLDVHGVTHACLKQEDVLKLKETLNLRCQGAK